MLTDGTREGTINRVVAFLILGLPIISVTCIWALNGAILSVVMVPSAIYLVYVFALDVSRVLKGLNEPPRGFLTRGFYTPLLLLATGLSSYQIWWLFASSN